MTSVYGFALTQKDGPSPKRRAVEFAFAGVLSDSLY
jgi:hypothetical protein